MRRHIALLPSTGRAWLKTLVPEQNLKVRFATLNVCPVSTGRTKELAELFHRRRIDFACLQETKWRGSKARKFGKGYKMMYTGSTDGRNGVAVVVSQEHLDNIKEVKRIKYDRIMYVKVLIQGETGNVIICLCSSSWLQKKRKKKTAKKKRLKNLKKD